MRRLKLKINSVFGHIFVANFNKQRIIYKNKLNLEFRKKKKKKREGRLGRRGKEERRREENREY